jgi:hypothetical protein
MLERYSNGLSVVIIKGTGGLVRIFEEGVLQSLRQLNERLFVCYRQFL